MFNKLTVVMVNFIYQLDWTTGCQYGWLNIILCVPVRLSPEIISI